MQIFAFEPVRHDRISCRRLCAHGEIRRRLVQCIIVRVGLLFYVGAGLPRETAFPVADLQVDADSRSVG